MSTRLAPEPRTLVTGFLIGESTRWHDGRVWCANWGPGEIIAADSEGSSEVVLTVEALPLSFDWLPDGRMLIVAGTKLLRREPGGQLVAHHADLAAIATGFNEIVVDGRGNAYVNGSSYNMLAGESFKPGVIAVVTPDGVARQVADDIHFPNGMLVTADNRTLIVAESYARRLSAFDIAPDGGLSGRRVWANLGESAPDGICCDAEGAVWVAEVPGKRCFRVAEGGEVLDEVKPGQACFACMLGDPDGTTLYINTAEWLGAQRMSEMRPTGKLVAVAAPAPHAGWP